MSDAPQQPVPYPTSNQPEEQKSISRSGIIYFIASIAVPLLVATLRFLPSSAILDTIRLGGTIAVAAAMVAIGIVLLGRANNRNERIGFIVPGIVISGVYLLFSVLITLFVFILVRVIENS
jgi:hypothetical protein